MNMELAAAPSSRTHALAWYTPGEAAARISVPGPMNVAVRLVASRLKRPAWACAVVAGSAGDPKPNQPDAGPDQKSGFAITVWSRAARVGSAIDPVSSDHPPSLAVVIPMRWNVAVPSQVDLSVIATGDSDAAAIRSHARAR